MKIKRIDVDGCGALTDTHLEFGDGLVIIHGDNEAGKTTLLRSLHAGFCHTYTQGNAVVQRLQRKDDPRRNPVITLKVARDNDCHATWKNTYKPSGSNQGQQCSFQCSFQYGQADQLHQAAAAEALQQFLGPTLIGPLSVLLDPNWTAGFRLQADAAQCLQDILNNGPGAGLAEQILGDVTGEVDTYWTPTRAGHTYAQDAPMRVAIDARDTAENHYTTLNNAFQAAANAGCVKIQLEGDREEAKKTFLDTCRTQRPTSEPHAIWEWLEGKGEALQAVCTIVNDVANAGKRLDTLAAADNTDGGPWLGRLDKIDSQWQHGMRDDLHAVQAAKNGAIVIKADNAVLQTGDPPGKSPSNSVVVQLPGVLHVNGERLNLSGQSAVDQAPRADEWLARQLEENPFDDIEHSIAVLGQLDQLRTELGQPQDEQGYEAERGKIQKALADWQPKIRTWPACLQVLTENGDIDQGQLESVRTVIDCFLEAGNTIGSIDDQLKALQHGMGAREPVTKQQVDEAAKELATANAKWNSATDTANALLHLEQTLKACREARLKKQARFPGFADSVCAHLKAVLPDEDQVELGLDLETGAPNLIRRGAGKLDPTADKAADLVSQGTREQIDIAVRLAYAQCLSGCDEPALFKTGATLVIDDALVHTDDDRLKRVAELLLNAAIDLTHPVQVIVATASSRLVDTFRGLAKDKKVESPMTVMTLPPESEPGLAGLGEQSSDADSQHGALHAQHHT